MHPFNDSEARPDARGEAQAYDLPYAVPPRLACGLTCARSDTRPDARGGARLDPRPTAQGVFCEHGLSALQINVLALILRAGARVTPYARIARQLTQEFDMAHHAESVRGTVNRLAVRGFIRHKLARSGMVRGVRFETVDALICPHIIATRVDARSAVRSDAQVEARPEPFASPSILREDQIDRNLSISSSEAIERLESTRKLEALTEGDVAFHWPELAKLGFGTHQVRQVLQRLEQVGIGPERIAQGLTHAEWELKAGIMRDKNGEPVANPANWTFSILARQGYYRRPPGYVSPLEQAALDASEEKQKLAAARQAHFEAEYAAWEAGLSETERQAILTERGRQYLPAHITLKEYFRTTVSQKAEHPAVKNPGVLSAGGGQDV